MFFFMVVENGYEHLLVALGYNIRKLLITINNFVLIL